MVIFLLEEKSLPHFMLFRRQTSEGRKSRGREECRGRELAQRAERCHNGALGEINRLCSQMRSMKLHQVYSQ